MLKFDVEHEQVTGFLFRKNKPIGSTSATLHRREIFRKRGCINPKGELLADTSLCCSRDTLAGSVEARSGHELIGVR